VAADSPNPPRPSYFRVEIWRRLQQIGAVTVKQSAYVMPKGAGMFDDLLEYFKRQVTP